MTRRNENRGPEALAYLMIAAAAFCGTLIAGLPLWVLT